jgi:ubiquitin-protein ligase
VNPRIRRLSADYEQLLRGFAGHPYIGIQPVGPPPPERYLITYRVPGLRLEADGVTLTRVSSFVVELQLPAGYPREKPYCSTADAVFHPNFGAHICIADFWNPSQSITDIVVQIGDMLQFRLYNTSSPLNAVAARWVADNINILPLGNVDLFPIEPEVSIGPSREPASSNQATHSLEGAPDV